MILQRAVFAKYQLFLCVCVGKCVCHAQTTPGLTAGLTAPICGIHPPHAHIKTHKPILSQQQNPQLDLCASFCLSYCPLIPSFWTPISSMRGFMRGRTSSLQRNTISIGLSTVLFQTRHPLNQGITVIQLLDNSISFYLPLSLSFSLNITKSDVINIDSAIVCRHFISTYIRLKCPKAKTLYI